MLRGIQGFQVFQRFRGSRKQSGITLKGFENMQVAGVLSISQAYHYKTFNTSVFWRVSESSRIYNAITVNFYGLRGHEGFEDIDGFKGFTGFGLTSLLRFMM